jgi:serine/threonine protein kinase/tetratricopeptide (TPR) repeat protein
MTSEQWQKVKELFQFALERAPEERHAFLVDACNGDDRLVREVISLLKFDARADAFIEAPATAVVPELFTPHPSRFVGRRIGPYRILKEIGQGGMGAVCLAERADEQYEQRVAVKLVKPGLDSAFIINRFLSERQILANLDHPNIANLLDGGTTEDGSPYLVMEFIDGLPVDQYCDANKLPIKERLRLFSKVCAAVAHAHRKLVIHRDLKPSNVLVTDQGVPKLLDFGIAKILSPDPSASLSDHTAANLRLMTPDYASPEQVRGDSITTSSDIYSLGVLLYKLLTGHHPYRVKKNLAQEIERVVCEQEPERPSTIVSRTGDGPSTNGMSRVTVTPASVSNDRDTEPGKLRRLLGGDLDNIVLMAIRKEPQRRYLSVEQFSEDIRRHLEGLPVIARKDTLVYRTEKFVRRHKVGVAAAALVLFTLIAGIVGTTWQARVARTQRARAEQRFNDVRRLANSFMFEIHDSVQNLPGSTVTRQLLVTRALEYLNSLAQESHDDPSLQRELVTAYIRIGNVQGNPNNANLGDTAGAMQSYRHALSIAGQLVAANPKDVQARRSLGVAREKMSDVQSVTGDVAGAVESAQSSWTAFKSLADSDPGNSAAQQSLAISYIKVGDVLGNPNFPNNRDQAGSLRNYHSSLAIFQSLDKSDPNNPKIRRLLALVYERIGTMHEEVGNTVSARENYLESQVIRQGLATSAPENSEAVRDLAIAHEKIGNVMIAMGNLTAALESRRKSLEIFSQLAKADPGNVQARQSLAISHMHLGDLFGNPDSLNFGNRTEATKNYRAAMDILKALKEADPTDTKTQSTIDRINGLMQRL